LKPTIDDCVRFPIKSLVKTSRRQSLGSDAERQYFGTTQGVMAGVTWEFDQDEMVLKMGGATWPIVVKPNIRGTRGTRAYVKVKGRLFTYLLVINQMVGTRFDLKYRSQGLLKPYQRAEWKKTKRDRRKFELRPLKEEWRDRTSYGEALSASRSGSDRLPRVYHPVGRKLPTPF